MGKSQLSPEQVGEIRHVQMAGDFINTGDFSRRFAQDERIKMK